MGRIFDSEIHVVNRPDQFDFRYCDFHGSLVCLQIQYLRGSFVSTAFSDRMVRGESFIADSDHSSDSNREDPVFPKPGKLASSFDDFCDDGDRTLPSVLTICRINIDVSSSQCIFRIFGDDFGRLWDISSGCETGLSKDIQSMVINEN